MKVTAVQDIPTPPPIQKVILELTPEEARHLLWVSSKIGGTSPIRECMSEIGANLRRLGLTQTDGFRFDHTLFPER